MSQHPQVGLTNNNRARGVWPLYNFKKAVVGAVALITGSVCPIAQQALAQSVADRTLSDVKVENVGDCSTLTVNFNIRVQMLSYFPTASGREVHVRVQPLDSGVNGMSRESLRTPATVPEVRSIQFEGDNPSGPVLSLFFSREMRFEIAPGQQPQAIVLRIAKPGTGPICGAPASSAETPALPAIEIPAGLYTVNVLSQPGPLALTEMQKQTLRNRVAYQAQFEKDAQQWHRLRIGFFQTRVEAETARAKLLPLFPDAWVVKVSADERAEGVANRMDTGVPAATAAPATSMASEEQMAETARLIAEAETAIRDGDHDRAIQLLTNALTQPENPNTPRAQELLGLTRERKGQTAHAQAEYEEYLRRYPSGDAADRVRQRLAALTGAGDSATELRAASVQSPATWSWGARGSFSQFYLRDQSTTKFIDASRPDINAEVDNSVNLNQLLSSADITISGGNDRRQVQLRAAGSYTADFRKTNKRNIKSLTALYLDYSDSTIDSTLRIGRQTRNSSGVLGRFDGALYGWQAKPKVRFNLVGGFPVLTSRQTRVLKERYFYGASVDVGAKRSPVQTSVYWFDQRAKGGFIDRQSVGIETRFLKSRFNAFVLADYDVKYSKLNLGLLTLNYNFPDTSSLSLTADYRQSPLLTTYNAVIGQIDAATLLPILDLDGLKPFFTESEIYQLAKDRTLVAKSMTVSYSRPLTKKLQTNFDFTLSDTGGTPGTPASAGTLDVAAIPATGKEYYYGAQLVGTGLLWENDIYIFSGRYADTQRTRSYTADFNARVSISRKFRLSPRLRYGHRDNKLDNGNFSQWQPTLRLNYYPMRSGEVEIEAGGNFSRQKSIFAGVPTTTTERGFVLSAGYRIDF